MATLESFTLAPILRCFHVEDRTRGTPCGKPAAWQALDTAIGRGGYYCDRHRPIDATAIAADAPFRRVRLTVEVLLAGASWSAAGAHHDAQQRLERAVRVIGGWLDTKLVSSQVGRASPEAVRRTTPRSRGVAE